MNYNVILAEIEAEVAALSGVGKQADYIPELARVESDKFGMHLQLLGGEGYSVGNADERFSIQSIAKVLSLTQALSLVGDAVWERVNVEPSGNPFNSLVQLEYEQGIPRNPFINAGALVVADVLMGELHEPKTDFLHFVRKLSGVPDLFYNEKVARSEKMHGSRNAAVAHLLKSFGNLKHEVDDVLDFYFHLCSIEMTCVELSKAFGLFANHGRLADTGEKILNTSRTKRLNAVMQTCGFYDEAGEFTFKVGLPGKSGVGGGIVAVHPRLYTVATWSPRLNAKGNSVRGMKALELLTTKTEHSIF